MNTDDGRRLGDERTVTARDPIQRKPYRVYYYVVVVDDDARLSYRARISKTSDWVRIVGPDVRKVPRAPNFIFYVTGTIYKFGN